MLRIEIHPGDGGADAATFAHELGTALAKHTGQPLQGALGSTLVLDRL